MRRLVAHLPPESATHKEMFGTDAPWGNVEHLLADIADQLQGANWQRARAAGAKAPKPTPVRRPNPARGLRVRREQADMVQRLKDAQERHAERKRRLQMRQLEPPVTTP